jgi:hypothetical protein
VRVISVIRNAALTAAACAALCVPAVAGSVPGSTKLALVDGWRVYKGSNKPAATLTKGIAHLKGAIRSGTDSEAFVLPATLRPAATLYVKADLCNAHNGRLEILSTGEAFVQAENDDFAQAQCFTSLDGISFALTSDSFTSLTLLNGWTDTVYGTAHAAAAVVSGVVHLEGAMSTSGSDPSPFRLPVKFRPSSNVYVPVDLCGASNGRLDIASDGTVTVEAENGTFSNAQCFTSLDGVNYAVGVSGYTPLSLINGWSNAPFGTRNAAVTVNSGVVQFEGAIATTDSNPEPFVLPVGMRPSKTTYVTVDMCDATNGRLQIDTDGTVFVEAETDFANAQCFTSLEGASFHL